MGEVVVRLLIPDWRIVLLEQDLIWTQRLSRSFDIRDIADQTRLSNISFDSISLRPL